MPTGVITFEPHPRTYFRPDDPPFRLTPFRPKMRQFEDMGIDLVFALPFDAELASKSAENFTSDVLISGLGIAHVVVGYDFVFGKGRTGDTAFLETAGRQRGMPVTVVDAVSDEDGTAYSSTRIRDLLRTGRPAEAGAILGRPWEAEGHVSPGDQRGRTLGFPTINIDLESYLLPAFGVYAVRVGLEEDERWIWHDGVANLGLRPTIGDGKTLLEAHLLDFSDDLYGRLARVQLLDYIRPERKFDGLEALQSQITADCTTAREVLAAWHDGV
jgi:riboflavin kinase/FMN adenylyltransferase